MSRPLRVFSLSTLYPNDHTPNFGVFVERQMQAVMRRGDVDLTMVNPIGLPPFPLSVHSRYASLRQVAPAEQRSGVPVLRPRFLLIPGIGGRFNAGAVVRAVLPLARKLHAEHKFNLVDAQFFHPDGAAAIRIGAALGLPVSIKARGADIHHWGKARGTAPQVLDAGLRANGLLAVAGGIADDMAALGIPRDKIVIHRTGLDREVFKPHDKVEARKRLGLPPDSPLLACVGALIPRKGQVHAIEALAELPGVELLLAGTGADEAMLRGRATALGLSERVHFLGAVPHAELPWLLSAADLFVLPTASEGLANAWVEALACGTPVVTTPIPGARELLTDPAMGRMAERNGPAFAAAIRDLLANPPARNDVLRGSAPFSWEANAAALVDYWRGLIES